MAHALTSSPQVVDFLAYPHPVLHDRVLDVSASLSASASAWTNETTVKGQLLARSIENWVCFVKCLPARRTKAGSRKVLQDFMVDVYQLNLSMTVKAPFLGD